jgi:hypothetical protein
VEKKTTYRSGVYTRISLDQASANRDAARKLLREGKNPTQLRRNENEARKAGKVRSDYNAIANVELSTCESQFWQTTPAFL